MTILTGTICDGLLRTQILDRGRKKQVCCELWLCVSCLRGVVLNQMKNVSATDGFFSKTLEQNNLVWALTKSFELIIISSC